MSFGVAIKSRRRRSNHDELTTILRAYSSLVRNKYFRRVATDDDATPLPPDAATRFRINLLINEINLGSGRYRQRVW